MIPYSHPDDLFYYPLRIIFVNDGAIFVQNQTILQWSIFFHFHPGVYYWFILFIVYDIETAFDKLYKQSKYKIKHFCALFLGVIEVSAEREQMGEK